MSRILVVEDEALLLQSLRWGFAEEGYTVEACADGAEALRLLCKESFDLAVLDWMLPSLSGLEICRALRSSGRDLPVLMLTARDATQDVVAALDVGADDYLVKPFAFEELLARIRSLLRRRAGAGSSVIAAGDLRVDLAARKVALGDCPLALTAREYRLIEYFALHPGELLSKERLLQALWDRDADPEPNVVEVYVARLRRHLEADGRARLIHTVRGLGYRFEGEPAP